MEQQQTGSVNFKKQGLFFLMVGALTALVHLLALILFVQVIDVHPNFANFFAFLIAFVFGFTGHLNFTFRSQGQKSEWKVKLGKWFASSVLGFALNQLIFATGIFLLGEKYYIFIWIVATILVTLCTFTLAKFWAFQGKHHL